MGQLEAVAPAPQIPETNYTAKAELSISPFVRHRRAPGDGKYSWFNLD
jgi:hypothetical protein